MTDLFRRYVLAKGIDEVQSYNMFARTAGELFIGQRGRDAVNAETKRFSRESERASERRASTRERERVRDRERASDTRARKESEKRESERQKSDNRATIERQESDKRARACGGHGLSRVINLVICACPERYL